MRCGGATTFTQNEVPSVSECVYGGILDTEDTEKTELMRSRPLEKFDGGRRDEDSEVFAPDDDAGVVREVDAGRDGKDLAPLESPQSAEIDAHRCGNVVIRRDGGLGNKVDVELRSGSDFEVLLQVDDVLIVGDGALAVVNRIGRVSVDESPLGHYLLGLRVADFFGGHDVGQECVRISEDPDGKAQTAANQCANDSAQDRCSHNVRPRLIDVVGVERRKMRCAASACRCYKTVSQRTGSNPLPPSPRLWRTDPDTSGA